MASGSEEPAGLEVAGSTAARETAGYSWKVIAVPVGMPEEGPEEVPEEVPEEIEPTELEAEQADFEQVQVGAAGEVC